jgi:ribosome-associated toxin RatA of RatAB toxin-antitoxin module
MPTVNNSVCVKYTPEQMFDLVNDVEAYPQYLPLCTSVKVLAQGPRYMHATITLSKGKLKLSFTTANSMEKDNQINMNLIDGPFKHLRGSWRFKPSANGGCEASFQLDFEFSNRLLGAAFGGFFKEVAESLVDAFCRQAAVRYGTSPAKAR